jgi:hypothetical protein
VTISIGLRDGRQITYAEAEAAGRDEIAAAMRRKRHVPGTVRIDRTKSGTWYSYTRCANTVTGDLARLPVGQCSTEAEYSIDRGKLTKSSVAYFCAYETAEQKGSRRGA